MKKIIFLIIASLLVLGLVLPGCGDGNGNGEEAFDQYITFGVAGPMTDTQGEAHWAGAEMARDEINADGAGGVDVDGTTYGIKLVEIDTNEVHGTSDDGVNAMNANIAKVDFVVGGFRTESVVAYREVAMEAEKIFLNCGAATADLQRSVVDDYETYKYWFKATPYNEVFLITSLFKMTVTLGGILKNTLEYYETLEPCPLDPVYKVSNAVGGQLRVAVIYEKLAWTKAMGEYAMLLLPAYGFNITHAAWEVSAIAPGVTNELDEIAAEQPHIIFTIFSGPVGLSFSKERAEKEIPAVVIGINVEGQSKGAWATTTEGCNYDIFLDTWAENVSVTENSVDWFNAYVIKTDDYPVYNAATYDAIYTLKNAIEGVGGFTAEYTDDIIAWLEDPAHAYTEGVGAVKTMYYPMPNIFLAEGTPFDTWALNYSQVHAIYPDYVLGDFNHMVLPPEAGPYAGLVCDLDIPDPNFPGQPCWTTTAGYIAHDTVYGPGYQTGIGAQWQNGHKVGIWPIDLENPALVDPHGDWNLQYDGTADYVLPIDRFYAS